MAKTSVSGERSRGAHYTGASRINTGLDCPDWLEKALIIQMDRTTGAALEKQNQELYISQGLNLQ